MSTDTASATVEFGRTAPALAGTIEQPPQADPARAGRRGSVVTLQVHLRSGGITARDVPPGGGDWEVLAGSMGDTPAAVVAKLRETTPTGSLAEAAVTLEDGRTIPFGSILSWAQA